METFFAEYEKQLAIAVEKYPEEYGFKKDKVPEVAKRMKNSFARRDYNKDGRAIKATCKVLGIKHTYKEINHFLDNHV